MNDPSSADHSSTDAGASKKPTLPHGLIAGLVAVAAAICVIVVLVSIGRQRENSVDSSRTLASLGVSTQAVTTSMAAGYQDEDLDMLADPPTDAQAIQNPTVLKFSYLSGEASGIDPARWQPLLDHLSKQVGVPVEYALFDNVKAQLAALRDGGLHITAFNTGNVPRAVNTAGFVPLSCPGSGDEPNAYQMLIVVKKGSGLTTARDLKGKTLAFTRVGSNSGYKAPIVTLRDQFELLPEKDYDWAFSGGHQQSMKGLAEGRWIAAAVAGSLYRAAINRGEYAPDQFEVIHTSEAFPVAAIGCPHNLKPELEEAIKQALLDFQITGTSLEQELAGQPAEGFVPISYKEDFATTRLINSAFKGGS